MSWYCAYSRSRPLHARYHDTEYGFPTNNERVLFERLALEIMQAGLSWDIVMKKRKALNAAFDRFAPAKVAAYGARDVARLLKDASIIRNRRKIEAVIENARRVVDLRKTHGGFAKWLAAHHPQPKAAWVKLFKQQFVFTGPEIVNEFLMGVGLLPGAHKKSCLIYKAITKATRKESRRKNR
ncbi:MAG: DNA-3-methyladenine glycosylase I [Alphaproteobacteria bacterium]|nr:DNA-3-methyladenine glycosylase I [Alphaproteobacteria bacterium]